MTALITNGATDATANVALTGRSRIIVSGNFGGNANVVIQLEADSLDKAVIHQFSNGGAISVEGAAADTLTATVNGGDLNTSVDVSVSAL